MLNQQQNLKSVYLPTLDGWRAISILLVVFYHASESIKRYYGPDIEWFLAYLDLGSIGVSIFFGISGLLITSRLLEEKDFSGFIDLKNFYIRRAFRLLPPVIWMLLCLCILAGFFGLPLSWSDRVRALFLASNYGTPPGWYLAHTWSLSVEEHFYLFWPLLLISLGTKRGIYFALIVSLIITIWRIVDIHWRIIPDFIGISPWRTDTNLDYLLLGAALACLISIPKNLKIIRDLLTPLTTYLLIISGIISVAMREYNGHFQHPVRIYISLIIPLFILGTILNPSMWLSRLLEWDCLRWIGKLSFSLYLWQQLFIAPEANRVLALGRLQEWPWNIMAAFACAVLSYYFVEKPSIKIGHTIAPPISTGSLKIKTTNPVFKSVSSQ